MVLTATALVKGEGSRPGGAIWATRPAPPAVGGAGAGGADLTRPGPGSGAGSSSGPVATGPAARKGTTGTTDATTGTSDALFIWTGRDARVPAGAVGGQPGPSAPVRVQLGLQLTGGAGRGLAVVRMRNLSGKPLPVAGTVQLLITGPGVPVVVRQPVRFLIPAAQASTVRLSFRPPFPGVYRVRAIFVPS